MIPGNNSLDLRWKRRWLSATRRRRRSSFEWSRSLKSDWKSNDVIFAKRLDDETIVDETVDAKLSLPSPKSELRKHSDNKAVGIFWKQNFNSMELKKERNVSGSNAQLVKNQLVKYPTGQNCNSSNLQQTSIFRAMFSKFQRPNLYSTALTLPQMMTDSG